MVGLDTAVALGQWRAAYAAPRNWHLSAVFTVRTLLIWGHLEVDPLSLTDTSLPLFLPARSLPLNHDNA